MDRGVLTYIAAFITGIALSKCLPSFSPLIYIGLLSASLLFIVRVFQKRQYTTWLFIAVAHFILFLMGFGRHALERAYFFDKKENQSIQLREEMKTVLHKLIRSPQEQAVLTAITLGDKSTLPSELKKAYGESGAMHILALSGLHMGILYGFMSGLLFFLNVTRRSRIFKAAVVSLIILLYGYITGFPPSVQRAIIMILIQNILILSGRKTERYNLIAVTAFFILLIRPEQLFSISFQLSFAAVTGIAVIFPVIESCFSDLYPSTHNHTQQKLTIPILKWIRKGSYALWSLMGISISCQITTLPFTLFYFGSAPEFFLITNLAAIPIASAVLYTFIPAVILKDIPWLGEFTILVLQKLLELLNSIIQFIG